MSRVLLVDDDALLTELLTEYLTAEGLNVHSVSDGEAGVQEILTGQYDVVVLDSMMPKMNGFGRFEKRTHPKHCAHHHADCKR